MPRPVYLDSISAAPPWNEAIAAMQPYLAVDWGNPMSPHAGGDRPKTAVDRARRQVAALLGADASELIFTASGSEANNLAVKGIAMSSTGRRHLVTSAVEHPSVLASCRALDAHGMHTTVLPVDREGRVDPLRVEAALTDETCLVSIQAASSEIGTLQRISDIGAVTRRRGVPLHVDAVAAAGRVPIDVEALRVDALTLSSNQLGGPPGAGALYLRRGIRLTPLIHGGTQERGRRAGLENIPAIVGMGSAAETVRTVLPDMRPRLHALSHRLLDGIKTKLDGWQLTGHPTERLPGHISVVINFVEGEALVMAMSREGVAAAAGVTCRERTAWKASPALVALGVDQGLAQGAVVFSMWAGSSLEDVDAACDVLVRCVSRLRALSPLYAARRDAVDRP